MNQASLPKTYSYHPRAMTMVLSVLFFGACAGVLGWMAASNDGGLMFYGIFRLSEGGATVFYWTLSALSVGFVFIALLLTVQRAMGPAILEITATTVRIPHGFLKKTIRGVELRDVIRLSESEVQGYRFFYLHTQEKKYCLNGGLMPSKEAYEEAKGLVVSAISALNVGE